MTTRHDTTRRRLRRGFTLVEMMVAMAISLGIMLILAEAFKSALDFVRIANANAQLMNQLAGAGNALEHDLAGHHFPFEGGKPNGGVRLSDQWMHRTTPPYTRTRGGFFRIEAGAPIFEGSDVEGNALSTAVGHRLHFTTILRGGTDSELFTAISPPPPNAASTVYKSRCAEVAWFLVPTGEFTSAGANRMPLFNLVRRYRLVAMDDDARQNLQRAVANDNTGTYPEVISVTPAGQVNTLATVMTLANRLQLPPGPGPVPANSPSPAIFQPNTARHGEEVVLTNVLSFQVLPWWDGSGNPQTSPNPRTYGPANTEAPFDFFQTNNGVFDTAFAGSNAAAPNQVRVRAIMITIRVADLRVGIARSNTWKFEM